MDRRINASGIVNPKIPCGTDNVLFLRMSYFDHPAAAKCVTANGMLKILIAEDDFMIADAAEEVLLGWGYEVCGIARTVADGVALGRLYKPDLAIIDMRLADGGSGTEIAAQLKGNGRLGVLYATGNSAKIMLSAADGDACLSKPYSTAALVRAVEIVAGMVATGAASGPFPPGFQLLRPVTTTPTGI
jgi:CheY-like chemotaxis protein